MIVIASDNDITSIESFFAQEFTISLSELIYDYNQDESLTDKFLFIEYWKRIIKVIYHYKNKLQTFAYVIIRPIVHIRTLHTVY